jgi:hypothetical protein
VFKSNAVRSCVELHEIEQMLEHAAAGGLGQARRAGEGTP